MSINHISSVPLIVALAFSAPHAAHAEDSRADRCVEEKSAVSIESFAVSSRVECGQVRGPSVERSAGGVQVTSGGSSRPSPSTKRTYIVSACYENLGEPGLETCFQQDEAFCPGDSRWVMPRTIDTADPDALPSYSASFCTGEGAQPATGQAPAPAVSIEDMAELIPLTPTIHSDNAGRGIRNAETNFYTPAGQQETTTTINGQQVQIRATVITYTWDYGDGTGPVVTSVGGAPQPEFNTPTATSHVYTETGRYPVTLEVVYVGQFRVGDGPWQSIPGSLTRTAQPVTADIWATVTRNVEDDCTVDPTAWGCTGPIDTPTTP